MGTLTLKNTWKNLTLVAAGALMATMIAIPLGGIASADDIDDDLPYIAPIEAATYTIEGSNGSSATFELVETNGEMMLVLVVEASRYLPLGPEDDD